MRGGLRKRGLYKPPILTNISRLAARGRVRTPSPTSGEEGFPTHITPYYMATEGASRAPPPTGGWGTNVSTTIRSRSVWRRNGAPGTVRPTGVNLLPFYPFLLPGSRLGTRHNAGKAARHVTGRLASSIYYVRSALSAGTARPTRRLALSPGTARPPRRRSGSRGGGSRGSRAGRWSCGRSFRPGFRRRRRILRS